MGGSAACIDIRTVRIVVDRHHIRTKQLQCLYRSIVRCSFRAVCHNLHTMQIYRDRLRCMFHIVLSGIRPVCNTADLCSGRKSKILHIIFNDRFDLILHSIRQLIPVRIKKFNAVKFHRIMGCGNHNPRVHMIFSGQISNCRCRYNTDINRIGSDGAYTRH